MVWPRIGQLGGEEVEKEREHLEKDRKGDRIFYFILFYASRIMLRCGTEDESGVIEARNGIWGRCGQRNILKKIR